MAYTMYLDSVAMPITPSKLEMKVGNQNKTLTLIDGSEINILKAPGLTKISFELLLPNMPYPFATGTNRAEYYLSLLERLKSSKKPFQWKMTRYLPNEKALYDNEMTVGLEDYSVIDDAKAGFDIKVKVTLKQYREYGTKTVTITPPEKPTEPATATVEPPPRETSTAPALTTYTVKKGDCLWNIAKKYLGNGSRYKEIYDLNKDKIKNPNVIYPGQVLTMPS